MILVIAGVILLLLIGFLGYKYIPAVKGTFLTSCSESKFIDIMEPNGSPLNCNSDGACVAFANSQGVENAELRCNDGVCQVNDALCFTSEVTQ